MQIDPHMFFRALTAIVLCLALVLPGILLVCGVLPPNPVFGVVSQRDVDRGAWYAAHRSFGWVLIAIAQLIWAVLTLAPFSFRPEGMILSLLMMGGAVMAVRRRYLR